MNKLLVKCIRCGKQWEKESAIAWGPDAFSSSLCSDCFVEVAKETIRRKQKNEGNFDCFGTADTYCDQIACKYRRWCLHLQQDEEAQPLTMAR
ncbi:MAG: hypothetical protein JRI36_10175 [Deltaproteobacteria bacterium]|nr:hypothetical protein [Deltaproteobacteria bacterium]